MARRRNSAIKSSAAIGVAVDVVHSVNFKGSCLIIYRAYRPYLYLYVVFHVSTDKYCGSTSRRDCDLFHIVCFKVWSETKVASVNNSPFFTVEIMLGENSVEHYDLGEYTI